MQAQPLFDLMDSPWLRPSIQTPRRIARLVELQFTPYRVTWQVMQELARDFDETVARLGLSSPLSGAQTSSSMPSKDLRKFSR